MLTDADKIKEHLFSLTTKGIKYDLDRITQAAKKCGSPQNSFRIFHVAGTNGKGSTCVFLESILREQGYKTGLFLSPHIVKFEERFLINGRMIDERKWVDVYRDLHLIIDEFRLTFFEAITLIAFELFKREKVDFMVCETGLGGRLDATNIITPVVSVISSIAMDHFEYLGNTLLEIASEKAGIIKENVPVVCGADNADVRSLIKNVCDKKNTVCKFVSENMYNVNKACAATEFTSDGYEYQIKLLGEYQVKNAVMAIEAIKLAGLFVYDSVFRAIKNAYIPGRFEQVTVNGKKVIFDVGHNCQAAEMLKKNLQSYFESKKVCIVTGIMKDKDVAGVLAVYSGFADHIILTHPQIERAELPEKMFLMTKENVREKFSINGTVAGAVSEALSKENDIVCVCGSFYTVGEAFESLGISVG